jgi:hypothetical protein
MNFDRMYELLGLLEGDSERKTYIGRENSTGREVFVHLLAGGSEQALLAMAERYLSSSPDARSHLQIGIFQNQSCLITASGTRFRNIRSALEPVSSSDQFEKVQMWKVPAANETPAKPAAASEVGEFTRMFSKTTSPEPEPAPSVGDFTRMFAPAKPSEPPRTELTVPIDKLPVVQDQPGSTGSFTQMFSPGPAQSDLPSPPVSEFTSMFAAPKPSGPSGAEPVAPIDKAPAVQDKPGPASGFTQMFSAGPAQSEPGEFTRMFRPGATPAPLPSTSENWMDSSPPVLNMNLSGSEGATGAFQVRSIPPPPGSEAGQGPSEFTRMMSVSSALPKDESSTAPPPPAQPAPAEPARQKKSYLPMIIILNVLFIAAVVLVLVFLLKR